MMEGVTSTKTATPKRSREASAAIQIQKRVRGGQFRTNERTLPVPSQQDAKRRSFQNTMVAKINKRDLTLLTASRKYFDVAPPQIRMKAHPIVPNSNVDKSTQLANIGVIGFCVTDTGAMVLNYLTSGLATHGDGNQTAVPIEPVTAPDGQQGVSTGSATAGAGIPYTSDARQMNFGYGYSADNSQLMAMNALNHGRVFIEGVRANDGTTTPGHDPNRLESRTIYPESSRTTFTL